MLVRVDPDGAQRTQVLVDDVEGTRLEHHLKLVVVLPAVGVVAIAPVLGSTARLDPRGMERLRPQAAQKGRGIEGRGTLFGVVRLGDEAIAVAPVLLQREYEISEVQK